MLSPIDIVFGLRSVDGFAFDERVSFEDTRPEFKNISLVSTKGNRPKPSEIECEKCRLRYSSDYAHEEYEIVVRKNSRNRGPKETRSLVDEATVEAERFMKVFTAVFGIKFYGFVFSGYRSIEGFHSAKTVFPPLGGIHASARFTVGLSTRSQRVAEAKEKMSGEIDFHKVSLFADLTAIADPVSRFISLYAAMSQATASPDGEKQRLVDEAILMIDSTVAQTRKPGLKTFETVFTRLRNELSHHREGTSIFEVHDDVKKSVDRFEEIVRDYLLRNAF